MVYNNKTLLLLLVISLIFLFAYMCTTEIGDAKMNFPHTETTSSQTQDTGTTQKSYEESDPTRLETIEKCEYMELFNGFIVDNNLQLSDLKLPEYPIEELQAFFGNLFSNESPFCSYDGYRTLTISEVDRRFPIRCLRYNEGYYTVYKVREGGFYYVFWSGTISTIDEPLEPDVYFAAHLSSLPTVEDFNVLKEGVSSADNVSHIDPAIELNFMLSCGMFSYSLLHDLSVIEVEYKWNKLERRSDLIYIGKEIIKRENACSRYRTILLKDLQELVN